jgi:hypothetical protein
MDINGNQWNMYWLWMACWIGYPPVSSNIGWEIRKIPSKSGCVSQEIELELGDFQFFRRGHWSFSSYYGQKNITEIIPIFFCFLLYDPKLYYYSQIILFPWCFFIVWSYDPKLYYSYYIPIIYIHHIPWPSIFYCVSLRFWWMVMECDGDDRNQVDGFRHVSTRYGGGNKLHPLVSYIWDRWDSAETRRPGTSLSSYIRLFATSLPPYGLILFS